MSSTPDRGTLTNRVLSELRAAGLLVGDILAPDTAGWQTQPGGDADVFVPYVTLTPQTVGSPSGSVEDPTEDWRIPYTLTSFAVDRNQVEDYADKVRRVLLGIRRREVTMSNGSWQWQQTQWVTIGAVGYTQIVNPTAFSQTDSMTIWLSKNL